MSAIIEKNDFVSALEYKDRYFIQSSPYGYTVTEGRYDGGDFHLIQHTNLYNGQILHFNSIDDAMAYCDRIVCR